MSAGTSIDQGNARTAFSPIYREIPQRPQVEVSSNALADALARARAALIARQHPEGYWVAELQGDSILQSEYILLKFFLEHDDDPHLPRIANYLRSLQQDDGGWNLYPGGPADLSGTVKAYFALKLLGDSPNAPHMVKARKIVHQLGGAEKCNSFSNIYLATLGQISYDACPAIPPEIVFLPKWAYFNLYNVSAWTRTMILPLAIVSALRPVRKLTPEKGIAELFTGGPGAIAWKGGIPTSWRDFYLMIDALLKQYQRMPLESLRREAIKQSEKWLLQRCRHSGGLGAIFPPMVYILIVLRALGYPDDHPEVQEAHRHLRELFIYDDDAIRIQPCHSPVWDTGIALHALAESGLSPDHHTAKRATQWLLDKECRVASDWAIHTTTVEPTSASSVEPSGWYFEFQNLYYPDVDDTAMVIMAMRRAGGPVAEDAIARGINWLMAMQNDDGGWAAFDRTRDRAILEHVPFADHNALQDPSCPDIAGRVLESFGHCGVQFEHPSVQRAIAFLKARQEREGCWFGRWGVNYVYGTWQVLTGLRSVGEDMSKPYVQAAANWLRSCQKPDGSWGESCASYDDPALKGQGQSTASQTAWGLMGLLAASGPHDPAVARAVQWLIDHQRSDGNWDEDFYTGTGFPRVFYLKYHLYRLYFPLMALARYERML